jgi:hypothetical protein
MWGIFLNTKIRRKLNEMWFWKMENNSGMLNWRQVCVLNWGAGNSYLYHLFVVDDLNQMVAKKNARVMDNSRENISDLI